MKITRTLCLLIDVMEAPPTELMERIPPATICVGRNRAW